jgi:hypothetical protein
MKPYVKPEPKGAHGLRGGRRTHLTPNHRCFICDNRERIQAGDGYLTRMYKDEPCYYQKRMGLNWKGEPK